jgi:hypothetical protein
MPPAPHDVSRVVSARPPAFQHSSKPSILASGYITHDYLSEKRDALIAWHAALEQIVRPQPPTDSPDNVVQLRA